MNKVKFRGKCLDTGKWVYGDLIQTPLDEGNTLYKIWDHSENAGLNLVKPDSIGLFIGEYDKSGKEMYTGDIILFWRPAIYPEEISHNGDITDHYVKTTGIIAIDSFLTGAVALYYDKRRKSWMPGCMVVLKDMENIQEVIGNVTDYKEFLMK